MAAAAVPEEALEKAAGPRDCPRCGRPSFRVLVLRRQLLPARGQTVVRNEPTGDRVFYHADARHCAVPEQGEGWELDCRTGST